MTFRYLSFHGYHTWLDMKSCTGLLEGDSEMSCMTSLQEAAPVGKTRMRRRKPPVRQPADVLPPFIAFNSPNHPVMRANVDFSFFPVDLPLQLMIKCLTIWSGDVIDCIPSVFIFCLNLLFAFHIHWLHSPFPLLSMHEADSTGSPEIHNPPTGEKWMALMI